MRHKRIAEHKASNSGSSSQCCQDVEWEAILTATLVEGRTPADIDVRAEVLGEEDGDDNVRVELCLRKNIAGITVRQPLSIPHYQPAIINPGGKQNWCTNTTKNSNA